VRQQRSRGLAVSLLNGCVQAGHIRHEEGV
jgi:hypothetical protein